MKNEIETTALVWSEMIHQLDILCALGDTKSFEKYHAELLDFEKRFNISGEKLNVMVAFLDAR